MLDALLSLVGGGNSTLVAIIVGVFGVLGTFIMGRRSAKNAAKVENLKSENASLNQQLEMNRDSTDIERRNAGLSDAAARKEAMKWSK